MMKQSIFTQFVLVLAVSTAAAGARAEGRISVEKWSKDFSSAVRSGNSGKIQTLTNFSVMDKKISACDDCGNKDKMAEARKLYAQGKYDEARDLYNQIDKGSSYWLQAVEERAWTYFRQNQLEKSLAQTKTLLSPQFSSYVGSESFLLQSLAQLKSCNYKEVFATNRLFKEKQKNRLVEIQGLIDTGMNESFTNVVNTVNSFPMKFSEIGKEANHLPQFFYKDIQIQRHIMRYKLATEGLNILDDKSGFDGVRSALENTKASSLAQMQARMKKLAANETEDNFKIVQKLNLVEVEAIQRLHHDVELDKSLFKRDKFDKTNSDQLVFVDDGRPWIDELDKYQVRVKSCPQNIRRKM